AGLAACTVPVFGGNWHWRGMGDGRHLCGGGVARRPAQDGGGVDAYRILRRFFSGGAGQLSDRGALWLAVDVCDWRIAGAAGEFHPVWSEGAEALGEQGAGSTDVVAAAAAGGVVFRGVPQADDCEFDLCAGVDHRIVGWVGICAGGGNGYYQSQ